jgi:prolipoprotein diacylglyceryltransferase
VVIGRLRCLVQGCCHGRPVDRVPGIRYVHPRSRVCRIAHLDGIAVHPTPVYSIAANIVLGLLLLRLWTVGAPLSMIVGVYVLGAGLSRFVEEHLRGEPQTQIVGGLRIYQWCAIGITLLGIAATCIPSAAATVAITGDWRSLLYTAIVGAVFAAAMGVDLPQSERRFSRLA